MKAYLRIMTAVYGNIWAIEREKLEDIVGFLELKMEGGVPDGHILADIKAASEVAAARVQKASAVSSGSVAVLPLYGLIMQRGNMMGDVSGPRGTSVEQFKQQFRQALNDPSVKAIVIDVDSPGGAVSGVDELAAEIYAARGKKEITAVVNCQCASAAYYIASSATKIVASPSSMTGSIGVYAALRDETAMLEKAGVKYTLVTYGENKAAGDPRVPTSAGAVAELQETVNAFGTMFDKSVARGRKVTQAQVRADFGQGRMFTAQQAKKLGMVDDIGTLDDVLAGYGIDINASREPMMRGEAKIIAQADVVEDPDRIAREHAAMRRRLEIAAA
jgi:signal peptide peptidase SppA